MCVVKIDTVSLTRDVISEAISISEDFLRPCTQGRSCWTKCTGAFLKARWGIAEAKASYVVEVMDLMSLRGQRFKRVPRTMCARMMLLD